MDRGCDQADGMMVIIIMAQNQHTPTLAQHKEIRWEHYNYPPLIRVMHFLPKQIPKQKKFLSMSLFLIHIIILVNSLLNFIDSCTQGGLRILYSFLFILAFNPLILLLFYRGFTGICQYKGNLRLYFILQPIAIVIEIIVSIVSFFGFNGFMRVGQLISVGKTFSAAFAVAVSVVFLLTGLYSAFIYGWIMKNRSKITDDLQ